MAGDTGVGGASTKCVEYTSLNLKVFIICKNHFVRNK